MMWNDYYGSYGSGANPSQLYGLQGNMNDWQKGNGYSPGMMAGDRYFTSPTPYNQRPWSHLLYGQNNMSQYGMPQEQQGYPQTVTPEMMRAVSDPSARAQIGAAPMGVMSAGDYAAATGNALPPQYGMAQMPMEQQLQANNVYDYLGREFVQQPRERQAARPYIYGGGAARVPTQTVASAQPRSRLLNLR